MATHTLELSGCSPVPLAGYLKALGVFRIVATQIDEQCAAWWDRDIFHLRSSLSRDELLRFFLKEYAPTPLVAPWNGGSGFFPKDNKAAIDAIAAGMSHRFASYRRLISLCRECNSALRLSEKPDGSTKLQLLRMCRNIFPDASLQWLDAAFVITDDGAKYPPLLGTGGNDGRLEFTNNYMQRIAEIFNVETGEPTPGTDVMLVDSLFDECGVTRAKAAIGQFDPGSAGGANATAGYDGTATMNVWDFVLMLEGAIAFAGAAVRKLEHAEPGSLSYPFCVRSSGVGYGSSDLSDEATSRAEMWMPVWAQPAGFEAVSHVLSEGRVDVGRRRARNGVDFARAISSVGVDRGIQSFQRFGFQQRNGLSYFAVPLGRFDVTAPSKVSSLLGRLDVWLDRFRRAATGQHAPGRATTALRRLESAIIEACQRSSDGTAQRILIALSEAEAAIAISPKLREADYPVPPVPLLPPPWLNAAYDPSAPDACEFRLAAALASLGTNRNDPLGAFRRHVEPIDYPRLNGTNRRSVWAKHADDPAVVWSGANLIRNMNAVLHRRLIDSVRSEQSTSGAALHGRCPARSGDVFRFVERDVDDERIESLTRGLMLLDWEAVQWSDIPWRLTADDPVPSAAYCLMKLCFLPHKIPAPDGSQVEVKLMPQIARRAIAGDLAGATELASRRLYASGFNPAVDLIGGDRETAQRTAAAILFPLGHDGKQKRSAVTLIRDRVLRCESPTEFNGEEHSEEFPAHASD
ncbi:MAG: type I-U CRISPR-associated protein Csx17 [Candidatus Paceibacterota bacterium]